jgi:hypothetical protein
MVMVAHHAVGLADPVPLNNDLPQKVQENLTVVVIFIYWLLAVTSGGYMIKSAWEFNA